MVRKVRKYYTPVWGTGACNYRHKILWSESEWEFSIWGIETSIDLLKRDCVPWTYVRAYTGINYNRIFCIYCTIYMYSMILCTWLVWIRALFHVKFAPQFKKNISTAISGWKFSMLIKTFDIWYSKSCEFETLTYLFLIFTKPWWFIIFFLRFGNQKCGKNCLENFFYKICIANVSRGI